MKSLAQKHRYFEIPSAPRVPLGPELEALLGGSSAPAVCAHGLALVLALRPAEFVGTEGDGDEAHDVYETVHTSDRGRQRLRVGLMPYCFGAQQQLLMIAITALTDAGEEP